MPRPLAVAIVYLLALVVIGGLGYFLVNTTINQLVSFALNIPNLLKPSTPGHPSPIARLLGPLGITDAQINAARQQILNWLESSAGQIVSSAVPIITSVATGIVDAIIVFILSIYLTADGPRLYRRLSTTPPRKVHTRLVFLSLHAAPHGRRLHSRAVVHVAFIGTLVSVGMAAFQVPYALLLGILAFFLEFVPILGTIASGVACVLVAFATRGFIIAALVLGYFIIVHILEGRSLARASWAMCWVCIRLLPSWRWSPEVSCLASGGRSLAHRWLASARPSSFPPGPNGALPIQTNSPGRPPQDPNPTVSQNQPPPLEVVNPASAFFPAIEKKRRSGLAWEGGAGNLRLACCHAHGFGLRFAARAVRAAHSPKAQERLPSTFGKRDVCFCSRTHPACTGSPHRRSHIYATSSMQAERHAHLAPGLVLSGDLGKDEATNAIESQATLDQGLESGLMFLDPADQLGLAQHERHAVRACQVRHVS